MRSSRKQWPYAGAAAFVALAVLLTVLVLTGHNRSGSRPRNPVVPAVAPAHLDPPPALPGTYRLTDTQRYDKETLFDYVNGQAPYYFDFGFRSLTVGDYAPEDGSGPLLVVDIYDVGSRRNACGLFLNGLPGGIRPLKLGNGGFFADNLAVFWKGPYYVRVALLSDNAARETVLGAAEAVAIRISDREGQLREFAAFPPDGIDPFSLRYLPVAALGLAHLTETFTATYNTPDGRYQLFLSYCRSPEDAVQKIKAHKEFLETSGHMEGEDLGSAGPSVWGQEKYLGTTWVTAQGSVVAGYAGDASTTEEAERRVRGLLERIPVRQ